MSIEQQKQYQSQGEELVKEAFLQGSYQMANRRMSRTDKITLQKFVWGRNKKEIDGIIGPKTWRKIEAKADTLGFLLQQKERVQQLMSEMQTLSSLKELKQFIRENSMTKRDVKQLQKEILKQGYPLAIDGIAWRETFQGLQSIKLQTQPAQTWTQKSIRKEKQEKKPEITTEKIPNLTTDPEDEEKSDVEKRIERFQDIDPWDLIDWLGSLERI